MNKLLRYSLVALLAMIGMNNALAEEVTIETNSTTFALSGEDYVANKDGVTFTYSKGTSTSDISGGVKDNQLRIYKNATFSISSAKTISKIVVTAVINNKIGAEGFVAEGYTAAEDQLSGTWTGSSNAVTLTASGGQVRITQVTVTLGDAPAVTVAAPTISGTTSFVGSTEVTITNNEEGAKVYYTTNGDDPTASSQEYAAPFRVTETTTVKAIAIKNGTSSTVASKTFTAVPSVANIAALNALQNNDGFAFAGEAVVVYVNGKYAYIKDDSGSSLVYDSGSSKLANLALGKKIAANWTGKVSIYKNLFEAVPDAVLAVTDAAAAEITYPEVEIADVVAANMNKVVVLKGVTYTALEGKNFMIDKGSSTVKGYNQFGLEIAAPEEGKTYDITGAISVYTEEVQFQPIAIVEATAAAADTWTVAGTLPLVNNEWDPTDTSADMTPNGNGEGVSSYEKDNIVLEKGTSYEFKVVKNHSWNEAYPAQNYSFTVDETGIYHVKIFFNTTTHEISVEKTKTGEAGPVTHTYSVIGNFKDDWKTDFDMTKGEDGLYKAVIEDVAKGEYKFKVRVDKAWTTSYPASDYQLTVDADNSTVTVTFDEATKEVNATVQASSGITAVMAAQQNGAIYNLAGQKVDAGYKGLVIMNGKKVIQK